MLKEKKVNLKLLTSKHIFQKKKSKIKTFSNKQKLKELSADLHHKNVKGSFSGRRKMIPNGNLDLHKALQINIHHEQRCKHSKQNSHK